MWGWVWSLGQIPNSKPRVGFGVWRRRRGMGVSQTPNLTQRGWVWTLGATKPQTEGVCGFGGGIPQTTNSVGMGGGYTELQTQPPNSKPKREGIQTKPQTERALPPPSKFVLHYNCISLNCKYKHHMVRSTHARRTKVSCRCHILHYTHY